jgi:hypothetical protein
MRRQYYRGASMQIRNEFRYGPSYVEAFLKENEGDLKTWPLSKCSLDALTQVKSRLRNHHEVAL